MKKTLGGKYEITETIGEGGMAVVYGGTHLQTERAVAIKRLLPKYAVDESMVARFQREARAAGRIRSSHVVEVLDIDVDDDGAYLVMDRLRGESLHSRLSRRQVLTPAEIFEVGRQMLAGLRAAHAAGVIHRDLKPGNVFFAQTEHGTEILKIVDFGISKIQDAKNDRELTEPTEILGTLSYLSPEQIRRRKAGPESDLWSVGVVLYRCLTGRHPFDAEDNLSLLAQILEQPPAPLPADLAPEVLAAFGPFLSRALEKNVNRRFGSADEMREALEAIARSMPAAIASAPPPPRPFAASGPHFGAREVSLVLTSETSGPANRGRIPRGLLVAVVAMVVLGSGVGIATARRPAALVRLDVTPPDAIVTIDGRRVDDLQRIDVDGRTLTATVAAEGYRTRSVLLPSRGPTYVRVALAAAVPARAEEPPSASSVTASAPTPSASPDVEGVELRRGPSEGSRVRVRKKGAPAGASSASSSRGGIRPIVKPPY